MELHVGVVDCNRHFGHQDVIFLAVVPLVVGGGDTLALVAVAHAHLLLPFHAVPFQRFTYNHTVLLVVLVVVMQVVVQYTVVRLVYGFTNFPRLVAEKS